MANNRFRGKLDEWQYRVFQWVLFIIFLYSAYQFLNNHVPISKFVTRLLGR
jgi:hypothetical protein